MSSKLSQAQALMVLNALPHVGPVLLRRLMDAYAGDAIAVLNSNASKLTAVKGVGEKAADTLMHWADRFDLAKEESALAAKGTRFITQHCDAFPEMLRETYDPPIGLYWQGEYIVDRPCVAIVGTRKATLYGLSVARKFGAELSKLGFCIVSGMARGTDTAAHEGALSVGGKTVAVFGCGLDIIYPPENLELYREIVASGAVASEFPFGRRADRQTFPMRNRVVAGMSEAVIVIESDKAGGSMITARFAGEQGRQVLAVPGRIDQASSAGCHQLIRDGATLVRSVDDILSELRYLRVEPKEQELNLGDAAESDPTANLSADEQHVLEMFRGGAMFSPDALAEQLGKPIPMVSSTLMSLELKRMVAKRADGRFEAR
ncbi:MAG: DNA-processing protein DprA [Coraliomargarita sp.]